MSQRNVVLRVCLIVALSLTSVCNAQDGIPKSSMWLVDSALSILDMNRRDCALRPDFVTTDAHRLGLVNSIFANPFKAFEVAGYHAKHLRAFSSDNSDIYFTRVMNEIQLGVFKPIEFSTELNLKDIAATVTSSEGKSLPLAVLENFTMSFLIRQYVGPVIQAAATMQSSQALALSRQIIFDECDSLLMMSEEDANANPYEMKSGELRADSISRLFFDEASYCDLERVYSTTMSLYRELNIRASNSLTALPLLRDSIRSIVIDTKYGRIAIGGAGDDVYTGDYLLIIDVGGNDKYFPTLTKRQAASKPIRAIVDLAGNDLYFGSSYTLASGVFGGSILLDLGGNDTYKAASFSLGAGLFGVGILHDHSGTDSYSGAVFSEGAGAFGVGMLIDDAGNDMYSVQANGQGFGFTKGLGAIADKAGNDVYATVSPFVDLLRYDAHYVSFTQGASLGQRPIASGGVGILCDVEGNDSYTCDIYGQGSAYWFGLAALIDEDGEDRYQAYQYAQGAGIHFAHGILWDKKGDDVYVSHGVSQGCGHDVGFGMLLDERGNDSYVAESLSLGGGNANAVSIFADERGDDSYIARSPSSCLGYSDFRRSYGMIGIFADGSGNDLYGENSRNTSATVKSTFGVFLDKEEGLSELLPKKAEQPLEKTTSQEWKISSTLDSLFTQASTAPQKFQYMVNPARDSIVARGQDAEMFVAQHFSSATPRERLALEYIVPKLVTRDSASMNKLISDSLNSSNISTLNFCLWTVGKCRMSTQTEGLESALLHKDWRIRAMAAQQIGEAGLEESALKLAPLLKDTIPFVRMRAAYTIAQLHPEMVNDLLRPALKDNMQLVRNGVGMGLKANKSLSAKVFANIYEQNTGAHARYSLVRAIQSLDTSADIDDVLKLITDSEPDIREAAYRQLSEMKSTYWQTALMTLVAKESDPSLRVMLQRSMTVSAVAVTNSSPASVKQKSKTRKNRQQQE